MSTQDEVESGVSTVVRTKLKPPSFHKVILLNDDYTPMNFVEQVLIELFGKTETEARDLMMRIHERGRGVAGIYNKEIAEQKTSEVVQVARRFGHPLKAISEEA